MTPSRRHAAELTRALIAAGVTVMGGCAGEPLPTYPDADPPFVRAHLSESGDFRSIRSSGEVVLTRESGDSVTCDAALLARGRDQVRLRAWKLGQPVLDFTLNSGGLWVMTGESHAGTEDNGLAELNAARFRQAWSLIAGGFFEDAAYRIVESDSKHLVLERTVDSARVRCTVDTPTLTPRLYEILDEAGTPQATVRLSRYRVFGTRVWAMRLEATGPRGSIRVDLDDVEFDTDLPESVFTPPARAVRQP